MGIRDRVSRLKEKLDLRSKGKRRKPDGAGSGTDGEGAGPAGSLPRPITDVVAGGHDGGGDGSNADEHQVHSRDQPSRPDMPVSALNEQGGRADVDGEEVGLRHLCLGSGVAVAVGSGPGQEWNGADGEKVEQVYSPMSVSSIPRDGGYEGMWTRSIRLLFLIIPSGGAGTYTVPDHAPGLEVLHTSNDANPSAAPDKDSPNSVSAAARILCGVRDSPNTFGPLRSIARALCFILESCDVCCPSCMSNPQYLPSF